MMTGNGYFSYGTIFIWWLLLITGTLSANYRPFRRRAGPNCSAMTNLAGFNCPCRLEGQKCAESGTFCINGRCSCKYPAFLPIMVNGQTACLPTFTIAPSITVPASAQYGVTVPCNLPVSVAIPGFRLIFTNAVRPVFCEASTLFITSEAADNPVDMDTLNPATPLSYIIVDQNTGEIVPKTTVNVASGAGTFLTETYTGYCIDSRGLTSNTVSFKITWPNCP